MHLQENQRQCDQYGYSYLEFQYLVDRFLTWDTPSFIPELGSDEEKSDGDDHLLQTNDILKLFSES